MSDTLNSLGQPIGVPVPGWTGAPRPTAKPLTGRFCQQEPLDRSVDAERLFAAYSGDHEGRNWTYLPNGPFASLDDFAAWMHKHCAGAAEALDQALEHDRDFALAATVRYFVAQDVGEPDARGYRELAECTALNATDYF